MITTIKEFLLYEATQITVHRNLDKRKDKLKEINRNLLQQEVIDGDFTIDSSFSNIKAEDVKTKRINGFIWIKLKEIPVWLKNIEVFGSVSAIWCNSLINSPQKIHNNFFASHGKLQNLEGCPFFVGGNFYLHHHDNLGKIKFTVEDVEKMCKVNGKINI
jgi:hypothetical protein